MKVMPNTTPATRRMGRTMRVKDLMAELVVGLLGGLVVRRRGRTGPPIGAVTPPRGPNYLTTQPPNHLTYRSAAGFNPSSWAKAAWRPRPPARRPPGPASPGRGTSSPPPGRPPG